MSFLSEKKHKKSRKRKTPKKGFVQATMEETLAWSMDSSETLGDECKCNCQSARDLKKVSEVFNGNCSFGELKDLHVEIECRFCSGFSLGFFPLT